MLKLENQVCNLDLAKRLKELGVKQESLFWWDIESERLDHSTPIGSKPHQWITNPRDKRRKAVIDSMYVSAFTVAELGEMFPMNKGVRTIRSVPSGIWVCEDEWDEIGEEDTIEAATEADARAKMLIYLLENHLITL